MVDRKIRALVDEETYIVTDMEDLKATMGVLAMRDDQRSLDRFEMCIRRYEELKVKLKTLRAEIDEALGKTA